jgi:RHS repeat-associated protein
MPNAYLFTGREWDSETALYYYRTRYHHPRLGRFLTRDTIDGDDTNRYSYVLNNPMNYIDPYGESLSGTGGSGPIWGPGVGGGRDDGGATHYPGRGDGSSADGKKKKGKGEKDTPTIGTTVTQEGNNSGNGKKDQDKDKPKNPKPGKQGGPKPRNAPENAVENPNRKGSWGEYDKNGNFVEKWRFDKGQKGKPGWGGKDHVHVNGGNTHLPPNTPYPYIK